MKVISRPKFKKTFTCEKCHTTYRISSREISKNGTQSIMDKNKYIVSCPYCYCANIIDISKELKEVYDKI